MKCLLSVTLMLVIFCHAEAQTGHSITYKWESLFESENMEYDSSYYTAYGESVRKTRTVPKINARFVYNDSFSFFYTFVNQKDPLRKKYIFSEKMIHHSYFNLRKEAIRYNEVDFPKGNTWLIKDTFPKVDWIFYEDTKIILGYGCKPALKVSTNNDSTLVWFTGDLGSCPDFPNGYNLPGVPLQVYSQSGNIKLTAIKIDSGNYEFILPKKRIVTLKEYFELRKKK